MAEYRLSAVVPRNGRLVIDIVREKVRVMCRAEGYAMVRRKGAMPFCVPEKDLRPSEKGRPA